MNSFEEGAVPDTFFLTKEAAESWYRRVQQWEQNLRRDLAADSVFAPGNPDRKWLLFRTDDLMIEDSTGAISCYLCKFC